jgi:predicted ATPase/class 3 adenylate cyclase
MEVASTYIPLDRRHALARGQSLPEYTTGAALFADISGFTPLTEALARQFGAQRGVEELTHQLELVYTSVIAEVERYHGSVISFSGDAITCWFDGDEASATRQATTAALAMQKLMSQVTAQPLPSGDRLELEMKAAVASGPIRRFVVGDPDVQLFDTLAGATLERLVAIEELTDKGEVVLSIEAVRALGEDVVISEWRSASTARMTVQCAVVSELKTPAQPLAWPPLPGSALSEAQTRPWLLPEVHERLQTVKVDFLAELRQAVAVFLKFSGLDYDADLDVARKLDAFVRWVQQVVARYEGSLLQLTIGDKGSYLYIVFGAFLSHEDDAARSVAAARVLCQPPAHLKSISAIQIGISKGQLRAGPYGSATYRTYGLLGDDVNLAARLMQTARPGQTIVSGRIAKAVPGQIWESLLPLTLKGRAEPVSAFALITNQPLPRTRPQSLIDSQRPLIGREAEKAVLTSAFNSLTHQQSHTLVVTGEAGIGKSRLVSNALADMRSLGVTQLIGFGDAIEQTTPYYAWRSVFGQLFDREESVEAPEAYRLRILDQLPVEMHDRAPLLNAVLPLDWPESDLTAQLPDGPLRADNIREFLLDVLQVTAKRQPTVLVLEDIHWFDSASWALTLAVSRRVHPLLLILVARPWDDQPAVEYQQLVQAAGAQVLTLDSLSPANTESLVCRQLGVSALPSVVSQLIQEKAEGHPFFSEELAFAMRDSGLIQINAERGECRVAPNVDLKAIAFPDTVQDVIIHRIDRLAPQQQLTLKAASAIGRNFAFQILSAIHPEIKDKPILADHLETLARLELISLESTEPDLTYFFKHAITQEVAYNLMLFSQRRQLHQAIAEWYEQAHADNLTSHYSVLSYHWRKAEHKAKTIEYLEKAGDQALADGAYREAIKFYGEALELDIPPLTEKESEAQTLKHAHWMSSLGEAYRALGQMAQSHRYLEQSVVVFDRKIPATTSQKIAGILRELALQTMHRFWPERFIGKASAGERNNLLKAAHNYQDLTAIYLLSSDQIMSLYMALRIINATERAGRSAELSVAYGIMGLLSGLVGLHRLAENYLRLGLTMAEDLNQLAVIPQVLTASALYRAGIGQWQRAKDEITRALDIYVQLGNWQLWIDAIGILAVVERYMGNFETSRTIYAGVYASRERHGDLGVMLGSIGQGGSALAMGQTDTAIEWLEEARASASERVAENTSNMGSLAWAYLRKGDPAQAEALADATAQLIAKHSPPSIFSVVQGYTATAQVYLTLWETESPVRPVTKAKAKQACQALWACKRTFPIAEPSACLYQAWYDWLSGDPRKARQGWQKSLAAAQRLMMPFEEACAYYEMGRHAAEPERTQLLNRALAIFQKVEAAYEVAQVQTLLSMAHA